MSEIRAAFDRLERKVGVPLEQFVATQGFTDFMIRGVQTHLAVGRLFEAATRTVWHAVNLPTRTDLAFVSRQIASLEHDVRRLTEAQRAERRHGP